MATCRDMYNKERNYVLKIWAASQFFFFFERGGKKKKAGREREPCANSQFVKQCPFFKPNEVRFPQVF